MTEQEKLIADLGKPRLGERNVIRIRIRESKEFKVKLISRSKKIITNSIEECRG